MEFTFDTAVREKIYTKIALMGASGSGKTYSALRIATGMLAKLKTLGLEQNGRIAFINTEGARGRYYADEFKYDILDLEAPYSPERYVQCIEAAVTADYPILIVDSTSQEWEGKGGCLELQQLAGGTYQAWSKITPRHDRFIIGVADSPIHTVATMRGKDQYVMSQDSGKTTISKVGVGAKQREGFEYEFTASFLIDHIGNLAIAQKDNTHLFEDEGAMILSEKDGEKIITWANSGKATHITPKRYEEATTSLQEEQEGAKVEILRPIIVDYCKALGGQKNKDLMAVLYEYESEKGNPNRIESLSVAEALKARLEKMIAEKKKQEQEEVVNKEQVE